MCAQGCLLIRERACGRRHLRTLAHAHNFYSYKMLQELLPTVKAVTFQKTRRYPVIFQEKKQDLSVSRKSCSDQNRTEDFGRGALWSIQKSNV